MSDWTGNSHSTFSTLGASNHSDYEREERDFYATSPEAIDDLVKLEKFGPNVWEPCAGNGHLSKKLIEYGFNVRSSDIIQRDFPVEICDFLLVNDRNLDTDVVTNPPYKWALECCEQAIKIVAEGRLVAMFLKLTFLEGQKRRKFFNQYPPSRSAFTAGEYRLPETAILKCLKRAVQLVIAG